MNLANTFARIKKLFEQPKRPNIQELKHNEHLLRDLGISDVNQIDVNRLVHDDGPVKEGEVAQYILTRAP